MLAKPLTFMNLSGRAVAGLVRAYLDDLSDLIVVYDDIDLPLGRIRIRESGSAGSHNGMKSILAELVTERFARLRFGIGGEGDSPGRDLADFVLDRFDEAEVDMVGRGLDAALDALIFFVRGDIRGAMSRFNRDMATEEKTT
jgi:PTH1 family peptidyl-tRNA hydrolase